MFRKPFFLALLISFLAADVLSAQHTHNRTSTFIDNQPIKHVCELPATDVNAHFFVRSNPEVLARMKGKTQTMFEVDFSSSCNGQQWPQEALEAFDFAMSLWAEHVHSEIPIKISANWASLNSSTLASATPGRVIKLPGSIYSQPDTWYAISQLSAMAGQPFREQLDEVNYDINMNVNCDREEWYFGTDANVPAEHYDFVTVILHEIGHGLGFLGGFSADNAAEIAEWAFDAPIIYDRFAVDGNGNQLINTDIYPNPSGELYNALTGERGGVFFDGENTTNSLVGFGEIDRAKIFTPDPYKQGSSYSHLDLHTFRQTINALMVPNIDQAFAIHTPGPLLCGILSDMGWPLGEGCLDLIDSSILAGNFEELNFGVINLGETSERTVVISNREDAELPLTGSLEVESDQFSVEGNSSFSIEPGASQEFTVSYIPTNDVRHRSNLLINHDANNEASPVVIPVIGEALEAGEVVQLYQSYPNPFVQDNTGNISNPIIEYSLSEASDVLLDVFTISGKHVLSLVQGRLQPGIYQEPVNLRGYTTGIYIYRIVVDGVARSGKMMYVR